MCKISSIAFYDVLLKLSVDKCDSTSADEDKFALETMLSAAYCSCTDGFFMLGKLSEIPFFKEGVV